MIYKEPANSTVTVSQIAAEIAHEIKNPLALIKANLQYVELCEAGSEFKKNYEVIYREIDRINEILYRCMDAAKSGGLELKRFKISELIAELNALYKEPCARAGIRFSVLAVNESMEVRADYDKIKQALINIVQNAKESVEATGRGDGRIDVSAFADNGYARILVADNGIGIPDGDMNLIGAPFFTRKENGNGLGISISREILRRHKGSVMLCGKDRGADATLSLPLYNYTGS